MRYQDAYGYADAFDADAPTGGRQASGGLGGTRYHNAGYGGARSTGGFSNGARSGSAHPGSARPASGRYNDPRYSTGEQRPPWDYEDHGNPRASDPRPNETTSGRYATGDFPTQTDGFRAQPGGTRARTGGFRAPTGGFQAQNGGSQAQTGGLGAQTGGLGLGGAQTSAFQAQSGGFGAQAARLRAQTGSHRAQTGGLRARTGGFRAQTSDFPTQADGIPVARPTIDGHYDVGEDEQGWPTGRTFGGLVAGAVAGFLAAGTTLGVANLAAAFVRPRASPIVVVGGEFMAHTPSAVTNFLSQKLGDNDMTTLLLSMYFAVALIALVIGMIAWRQLPAGVAGIGLFGLYGAFVAYTEPGSHATDVIPSLVGSLGGIIVLAALTQWTRVRQRSAVARDVVGPLATERSGWAA